MSNSRWVTDNDQLVMKTGDGSVLVPTAEEIFSIVFEKTDSDKYPPLTEDSIVNKSFLSFSRFPLELELWIEKKANAYDSLSYRVVAISGDVKATVNDFLVRAADHILVDNKWYPFAPGSADEVRRVFSETGIFSTDRLTLRQYLNLRKQSTLNSFIKDLTGNSLYASENRAPEDFRQSPLFKGELYPYQKDGLRWLQLIFREQVGGILADEMGLGKTIQIIAFFTSTEYNSLFPSLVVAPGTVLENWRREFSKFSPSIGTLIYRGSARIASPSRLKKKDIVITSYDTLVRDLPILRMVNWKVVILDEAQAIKNPDTKRTSKVKQIPRGIGIAVTGTPVENSLRDLWSITDFVLPGLLGDPGTFEATYGNDEKSAANLKPLVSPIILRRSIKDVANDLPERIDIPQILELSPDSGSEYEKLREETIHEYGFSGGLVSLTKLRMFCAHPFLVDEKQGDPRECSEKFSRLLEITEEIISNDEKVLIYTSYQKMIDIICEYFQLVFRGTYCSYIDGRVAIGRRQDIVDEFGGFPGSGVLILNPRTGGTGLNITAANHVIHYNPEWNPATEDQATARSHRRGQKKPVTVHHLFYANTIEEIIDNRLTTKRKLAKTVVTPTDKKREDYKDILTALKISPTEAFSNERE